MTARSENISPAPFVAGQRVIWSRTGKKGTFLGLGSHGATVDFGPGKNGGIKPYIPVEQLRTIRERKAKA
jgi:hypothetical protein